jgi:hypothetical protein
MATRKPDESFVVTPIAIHGECEPPYRGGAGVYNGEDNYPKRTPSKNAADEKVIDGNLKGVTNIPPDDFEGS